MQIARILPFSCHSATQTVVQYAKPIGIVAALAAIAFAVLRYYLSNTPKPPPEQSQENPPFDPPIKLVISHPAEQPVAYNVVDQLPEELISTIFNRLEQNSFLAAQLSQQSWYRIANISWECRVKARFGPLVAQTLRKSQFSWREVVLFVSRPIEVKSNRLADHKIEEVVSDPNALAALKKIHKLAGTHNFEEFQDALEALRPFGVRILNHRIGKKMPLAKAAASGIVKNAQLLVENGSANMVRKFPDDGFEERSALFTAAYHGHVDMVHYLLEQGAQLDLHIKEDRDDDIQQNLLTLINQHSDLLKTYLSIPEDKCLECLILILNAWRGKIGIESLRENGYAKKALNVALKNGHSDIADILMGYGVRLHQENCLTWAERGIINNDLPMLEMLHRRQLFDFIRFRNSDGRTLLALATTYNHTAALKFLQEIGVPNVIGNDGKSDSEIGRERFTKSQLKAILNCLLILDTTRPCFSAHHGNFGLKYLADIDPDYLDYLLQSGVDLNIPLDDERNTLLYHAVKEIFNSCAREYLSKLLNYGANPNLAGISGITPLREAERVYQEKHAEKSEEDCLGAQAIIQSMKELH